MKHPVILLLALTLASPAVHAEESGGLGAYLGKLKNKIEKIVPQKKLTATTAAGGVRGAAVESGDVYWKGEAQTVDQAELDAFNKALALAESGKNQEAAAAFAEFVKTYPESPLRKDADEAVKMLQSK